MTHTALWPRHFKPTNALLALTLMAIPALPIGLTIATAGRGTTNFDHIAQVLLTDMVATTLVVVLVSTLLATILGTALAWLVTAFDFRGRAIFQWTLALPLALPAYVSAYAWGDLLGVRGLGVGILVYVSTLFPYIYLAARSAFEAQSVCALEAARVLGAGPWQRFWRVALPMARPAIAAGAALAALEIAADYGAADHLGITTLTTGIFRAWFSMGDLASAARLSCILLTGVLILVILERQARTGSVTGVSTRWRTPVRIPLSGIGGFGASLFCLAIMAIGFLIPVGHLVTLALAFGVPNRSFIAPTFATAMLCVLGALATLTIAALGAFISQKKGLTATLVRTSALAGYATPGAVMALGVLAALSMFGENAASAMAGPLAIFGLCYAYAGRFTSAGLEPMSAGLEKATRSMREAATSLGTTPFSRFWRLEAPIAAPSAFAAALLVAVEIAKELPATTILRPFGLDTLAIRAHAYAADERLGGAAWPALAIVALALVPTLLFSHGLGKSRAGQS